MKIIHIYRISLLVLVSDKNKQMLPQDPHIPARYQSQMLYLLNCDNFRSKYILHYKVHKANSMYNHE